MADELDVTIKSTLEADVEKSASKIASQIPAIEKAVNARSTIKIQVEAESKNVNQQAQKAVSIANAAFKRNASSSRIDVPFNFKLNNTDAVDKEVKRLVSELTRKKGELINYSIDTKGTDEATRAILKYKNGAEQTVTTVLKLKKRIDELADGTKVETQFWDIDTSKYAENIEKAAKGTQRLADLQRALVQDASKLKTKSTDIALDWSKYDTAFNAGDFERARVELNLLSKEFAAINAKAPKKLPDMAIENFNANVQNAVANLDNLQSRFNSLDGGASQAITNQISTLKSELERLSSVGNATGSDVESFTKITKQVDALRNSLKSLQAENKNTKLKIADEKLLNNVDKLKQELLSIKSQWSAFTKSPELMAKWQEIFDKTPLIQTQAQLQGVRSEFQLLQKTIVAQGLNMKTFWGQLTSNIQKFSNWLFIGSGLATGIRTVKQMFANVSELDRSMTSLRKVSDETDSTYSNFLQSAKKRAVELASTLTDLVDATTNFSRLGFSLKDSAALGEVAIMYANVGDEVEGVDGATQSLISTISAFSLKSSDALSIIDKFNEVGELILPNYAAMRM